MVQRFSSDGALGIGSFIAGQHFVDRSVSNRMRTDTPPQPIQLLHDRGVAISRDQLQAMIRSVISVGLLVRIAHPAALESAVGHQFHAAHPEPLVAFIRLDTGTFDERAHVGGIRVGRRREQDVQAHAQLPSPLHFLQQPVLVNADARMADAGEAGGVQLVVLRNPVLDLLFARQFAGRKSDERARLVDQLAVRFAIRITADLAAVYSFGRFIDMPLNERG